MARWNTWLSASYVFVDVDDVSLHPRWICMRSIPTSRSTAATFPWWASSRMRSTYPDGALASRFVLKCGVSCDDRDLCCGCRCCGCCRWGCREEEWVDSFADVGGGRTRYDSMASRTASGWCLACGGPVCWESMCSSRATPSFPVPHSFSMATDSSVGAMCLSCFPLLSKRSPSRVRRALDSDVSYGRCHVLC